MFNSCFINSLSTSNVYQLSLHSSIDCMSIKISIKINTEHFFATKRVEGSKHNKSYLSKMNRGRTKRGAGRGIISPLIVGGLSERHSRLGNFIHTWTFSNTKRSEDQCLVPSWFEKLIINPLPRLISILAPNHSMLLKFSKEVYLRLSTSEWKFQLELLNLSGFIPKLRKKHVYRCFPNFSAISNAKNLGLV